MRTTPARPVDVEALFPEVVSLQCEATRLHPRRGEPGVRDSSVGGPLLWPAHQPWPHCTEVHLTVSSDPPPGPVPLVPVLQLYAADVPSLPYPAGRDLLQVLWCPCDHEPYYAPRPELRWRTAADVSGPLLDHPPRPAGVPDNTIPAPCVLHPERIVEYPQWDLPPDIGDALKERFERLEDETGWSYWNDLSIAPGIKTGGYPGWTQDPDWPDCAACGRRMDHLLTIASAEFDGGSARAWLPHEDRPDEGEVFDLPFEQRDAIQNAAGVMIGDMGGVYVFMCTHCPDQPYAWRSDCS
jgi:hypothetical protein